MFLFFLYYNHYPSTDDILGTYDDFKPGFAKRYANINDEIRKAVRQYNKEVKEREFPGE
ncbi:3-methyl-2-oxobutanoate hydroxymethyltransferase [Candidatus Woesearchaeota archaeon]|nr:3-methyl-2-oxobutanoate hydroxymethyltransferase [Candidatus Woesearchaeota archaeon]